MTRLDHLVFGVPDLDQAIELIEAQTGVRPAFGGRHPGRGTHNALLALGGRQYLEIIAIDPTQPDAPVLLFPELQTLQEPRFVSWALAVEGIVETGKRARAASFEVTGPLAGERRRSDGGLLKWQTLSIARQGIDLVPFFIAWGADATHPSQGAPDGCTLTSFALEDPNPQRVRNTLSEVGIEVPVVDGPRARLRAQLDTPRGPIELG